MTSRTSRFKTCCLWCCVVLSLTYASVIVAQTDPGADYEKALAEFHGGNYDAAAGLFARVESASPGKTQALLYEAKCLVHMQDFTGAENALHVYLTSYANSSDALYMLGFVLNRENHPEESLKVYTQAAALAPPAGDDLKIVGLDYVLLDDYADAIHWLEKAVERDAKNADAWYYLGRAYYTQGRRDDGWKAFTTVMNLDPHNTRAENNLGLILETDGKADAAIEAYRNAIAWQEQSSHPSEQPYVNLGNLLMEQGRVKDAIVPLETAAKLAPNNAYCHMILGMAYRQSKQSEPARRELERATELEPKNAKAHYQLGRLYKDMHDLDRAQTEFKKTAELNAQTASPKSSPPNP